MISRKNINYFNRVIVFFTAFILLFGLAFSQKVLALNGGSGSKALNFIGYRVTDNHTINIWIDKNYSPDSAAFKIFQGSGTDGQQIGISAAARGSNSSITGTMATGLSKGADIVLTTSDALVSGQLYTIDINNNITAHNGISLGYFTSKNDSIFSFTVPDSFAGTNNSGCTYSSSAVPVVNSWPKNNDTNISIEGNIWVNASVPVTNFSQVIAGLKLSEDGKGNLAYDSTIDETKDGDIYAPIVNDDHTLFYFPMTGSGGSHSYNLDSNAKYSLYVPEMDMINGQIIPAQTITFNTSASNVSTKLSPAPTSTIVGDALQIAWTAPADVANVSPAPFAYNIYASTDKYWNYVKLNTTPITDTSFNTSNCGLNPNTNYYFRITGLSNKNIQTNSINNDSVIESGFSDAVQATISTDTTIPVENKTLTVDANKTWKIRFNKDIAYDELTKQGIVVTDSKGNVINVGLELGQDNKTLIVTAPQGGYTVGENYILDVNDKVHSKSGKALKNEYKLYFNIKN